MFYTENTAYDFIPTQEQIDFIFKQGKKIAILNDNKLPSYIRENSSIFIIDISTL